MKKNQLKQASEQQFLKNYVFSAPYQNFTKKYSKPLITRQLRTPSVKPPELSILNSKRSQSIETPSQSLFTGSISDYTLGHCLGSGAYSIVKLSTHILSKQPFAIKIYEKTQNLDLQKKKRLLTEIKVMKSLSHPHIIKFKEAIDSKKQVMIVMEYAGGRSFSSYLKTKPNRMLPEVIARRYYSQILSAVYYCHSQNVIHRDIKLDNILLDGSRNVKIIDFGLSAILTDGAKLKGMCGTQMYMAPEVIKKSGEYGFPVDVWALGVLIYIILTGEEPFKGSNERELLRAISKGNFEVPEYLSASAKAIIKRILQVDQDKRPTCAQLLLDPWVTEGR